MIRKSYKITLLVARYKIAKVKITKNITIYHLQTTLYQSMALILVAFPLLQQVRQRSWLHEIREV